MTAPLTPLVALELIADGWEIIESSGSLGEMTLRAPDDWEEGETEAVFDFHGLEGKTAPTNGVLADIAAERRRQVEVEGWSVNHDDEHDKGEMAKAAGCYAIGSSTVGWAIPGIGRKPDFKRVWPWDKKWWKPKDRRSDLVRAGALILAEIERLDRLAALKTSEASG